MKRAVDLCLYYLGDGTDVWVEHAEPIRHHVKAPPVVETGFRDAKFLFPVETVDL